MAVREAEEAARALLRPLLEEGVQAPIDPAAVAAGMGIVVRYADLPSDESGKIAIPLAGQVAITVNKNDHPNRQRFTIAHELGHYILHRANGCEVAEVRTDYRSTLAGLGVDRDEIYANQFAAALLMPAVEVAHMSRAQLSASRMARRFGTSETAMEIRLKNLRLV